MKKYLISLFIIANIQISYSFACSSPPQPSVSEAFKRSTDVYLVIAESVKSSSLVSEKKIEVVNQEVIFKILEAWKGSKKVGDTLTFNTSIYPGGCGVSVYNDPVWLENESADKTGMKTPFRMSGIWLIYGNNNEQNTLTTLGRTSPFEYGGARDMRELYRLSGKKN